MTGREGRPPYFGIGLTTGHDEVVLVAEDNRYVREVIAGVLQSAGYHVEQVEEAHALLDRYQRQRRSVRLLIIDVDLPGRSGVDCLLALRAQGATVPAILITGPVQADLEDRVGGTALLLRKPFPISELVRLVSKLIVGSSAPAGT